MPIPAFTQYGMLPPGRHPASIEEFEDALVRPFENSMSRRPLFESWSERHQELVALIDIEGEWIGGSFVTAKLDPADIDSVTVVDGGELAELDLLDFDKVAELLDTETAREEWGVDSYVLTVVPEDHPQHHLYLHARGYWDNWLGRSRNGTSRGYVDVR